MCTRTVTCAPVQSYVHQDSAPEQSPAHQDCDLCIGRVSLCTRTMHRDSDLCTGTVHWDSATGQGSSAPGQCTGTVQQGRAPVHQDSARTVLQSTWTVHQSSAQVHWESAQGWCTRTVQWDSALGSASGQCSTETVNLCTGMVLQGNAPGLCTGTVHQYTGTVHWDSAPVHPVSAVRQCTSEPLHWAMLRGSAMGQCSSAPGQCTDIVREIVLWCNAPRQCPTAPTHRTRAQGNTQGQCTGTALGTLHWPRTAQQDNAARQCPRQCSNAVG